MGYVGAYGQTFVPTLAALIMSKTCVKCTGPHLLLARANKGGTSTRNTAHEFWGEARIPKQVPRPACAACAASGKAEALDEAQGTDASDRGGAHGGSLWSATAVRESKGNQRLFI